MNHARTILELLDQHDGGWTARDLTEEIFGKKAAHTRSSDRRTVDVILRVARQLGIVDYTQGTERIGDEGQFAPPRVYSMTELGRHFLQLHAQLGMREETA